MEVSSTGLSSGLSITSPCDEVHGKLQGTNPGRTTDGPTFGSKGQGHPTRQKAPPAEVLAGNKVTKVGDVRRKLICFGRLYML